jgi:hypothetical protein
MAIAARTPSRLRFQLKSGDARSIHRNCRTKLQRWLVEAITSPRHGQMVGLQVAVMSCKGVWVNLAVEPGHRQLLDPPARRWLTFLLPKPLLSTGVLRLVQDGS